ncbi:MAG: FmdB family transcriptional regulator [Chloroflexota bacterium]|nr:FmdB family transcriptional regulator [Chloroflexota bacterium]
MPTYAYRCTACSHAFDIFQKFTDEPLTTCPECGSSIRKVFQPVGIVFKGSGWYINDSRPAEKDTSKADASAAKDGAKPAKENGSPDSAPKSAPATADSSPAAAPVAAKAAAD